MSQAQTQPQSSTRTQLRSNTRNAPAAIRQMLPGLPRTGLTPQQQLEALHRVQNQAEQRVRLGLQLFKAAETHTNNYRQLLEQITSEREKFRDELAQDVTRSLHEFDQWIGQMDETFTQALLSLEERINTLEARIDTSSAKIQAALEQSGQRLDQAMAMLNGQAQASKAQPAVLKPQIVPPTKQGQPVARPLPVAPVAQAPTSPAPQNQPHVDDPSDNQDSVSYADILNRIVLSRPSDNPTL